jgi:predicted DNA-binding transcriptional regulator YafY
MNRMERLYALVEELRARAPRLLRAADAAARFEVSTRTIERDLLALQEAGVPIWAQPGPRGGYGLNVDTTLPPLNLTPAEAVTIATALAAAHAMPFADAGRSALMKLTAVMTSASKETASALLSHVRVAPGSDGPADHITKVVQQALLAPVALELTYRDAREQQTRRLVEPAGIICTQHGWYLAAWCRLRDAPRFFRLDRISRADLTAAPVTPPPLDVLLRELPFELAEPALM